MAVDQRLETAAEAIPFILIDDFHDRATDRTTIPPNEHQLNQQRLSRYADETQLAYLYTYIIDPEGMVRETSSSQRKNSKATQITEYFEAYPQASIQLKKTLTAGGHYYENTLDKFGDFRSYIVQHLSPGGRAYLACADIDLSYIHSHLEESMLIAMIAGLFIFVLGLLISYIISSSLAKDLQRVSHSTQRIGRFELQHSSYPHNIIRSDEVHQLMTAVESMKKNLRSFRKFVPSDLVKQLVSTNQEAELGAEKKSITVFFSDIENFTSIAEQYPPEELVLYLGEYLQAMSEEITHHQGTVDKYIGDAIMAFWGAPTPIEQHALLSCQAAIDYQQRLLRLRNQWQMDNQPAFKARIGIHTGDLVVGNIGSRTRLNYTVLGDTVNLAARLESLNKHYATNILISHNTYQAVHHAMLTRPIDYVAVKGKSTGVLVYELINTKTAATAFELASCQLFSAAFHAYQNKHWHQALTRIEQYQLMLPDDIAAKQLQIRCIEFIAQPPASDWNYMTRMKTK